MSLNVNKHELLIVSRTSSKRHFHYSLNGSKIKPCCSYKYLGVHITGNLSWSDHVQHVISEANRNLGFLEKNLKFAPSHRKLLAFISLVRPKLDYISSVWDRHQSYLTCNLEAVQNHAVRFIYFGCSYEANMSTLKACAKLTDLSICHKI